MSFVQIVEFTSSRIDEIEALQEQWRKETEGRRASARALFCQDRDRADHYVAIIEFESYDEAMRNSALPETDQMSKRMAELADGPPTFTNLDVTRVEGD